MWFLNQTSRLPDMLTSQDLQIKTPLNVSKTSHVKFASIMLRLSVSPQYIAALAQAIIPSTLALNFMNNGVLKMTYQ